MLIAFNADNGLQTSRIRRQILFEPDRFLRDRSEPLWERTRDTNSGTVFGAGPVGPAQNRTPPVDSRHPIRPCLWSMFKVLWRACSR